MGANGGGGERDRLPQQLKTELINHRDLYGYMVVKESWLKRLWRWITDITATW